MADWQDRIREDIELTSPTTGTVFNALWIGNDKSFTKKLGRFNYPGVPGEFIQDLDVGGDQYPMTIYFEGPNHDTTAKDFFLKCKEVGLWQVKHPTDGDIELQLTSCSKKDQPVTDGNQTAFDLNFVLTADAAQTLTTAQLSGEIDSQSNTANEAAGDQFNSAVIQDTQSQIQAIKDTVGEVQKAYTNTLAKIAELNAEINSFVNSVNRGITEALDAVILQPLALAGQIQALLQTPALIVSNIESKLDLYDKMATEMFGLNYENPTLENKNVSAVKELALSACLVGIAQVSTSSELTTRPQAIESAEFVYDYFNGITENLDDDQELFADNPINAQYFSQSTAFGDHLTISGLSIAFLLKSAFDLKIEKRFILEKPRSPIEITITEYGELGENDENFDFFIATNKLKSNDILTLPAGREVVVYV